VTGDAALEQAIHTRESLKATSPTYSQAPGRFHFMIRRLHSFMGLLFGGYITVHLLVNATGLWPRAYQQNVDKIHSLEPMLPLIEIATIFVPLLIHAIYGIYITKAGVKFNTTKYNYGGNIRYSLQRWTAIFLLAFIAFHVGTLHKWGLKGVHNLIEKVDALPASLPMAADGNLDSSKLDVLQRFSYWCSEWGGQFQPHNQAFQTTVGGLRHMFYDPNDPDQIHFGFWNGAVVLFYLLGIWSAVFHLANGLWTSAIAWGLTVSRTAQKRWGHVCLTIFIVVMIVGTTAWWSFTFAPAARGDVSRWNEATHTLPDENTTHEQDQGIVEQKTREKAGTDSLSPPPASQLAP
jgi:succinate dehydrogenase / fumarate reductase cytochrome b subunit